MAIYKFHVDKEHQNQEETFSKENFLSSLTARLFFFILLIADVSWSLFCFTRLIALSPFRTWRKRAYLNFKRSLVGFVSLFVSLFSPALGMMFACSYFLMYDRAGVDEVVPAVLRDQFREFFEQH